MSSNFIDLDGKVGKRQQPAKVLGWVTHIELEDLKVVIEDEIPPALQLFGGKSVDKAKKAKVDGCAL